MTVRSGTQENVAGSSQPTQSDLIGAHSSFKSSFLDVVMNALVGYASSEEDEEPSYEEVGACYMHLIGARMPINRVCVTRRGKRRQNRM